MAMDTTLVGVTLLSMAMAVALSVVVWRLLRDERRRSEARVAALADMMARSSTDARPPASIGHVDRTVRTTPPQRRAQSIDLPLNEPGPVVTSPLFVEPEAATPWKGRAIIMVALALVAAAGLLVTLTMRDLGVARHAAQSSSAAAAAPPLELLSLRDSRDAGTLTISGVVQNPRGGAMLRQVTVTTTAFDSAGAVVANGHALLDITALAPGDESPFVVSVPLTGAVSRYRIGFRGEDGRVIAHVDKRQRGAVADREPASVPGT